MSIHSSSTAQRLLAEMCNLLEREQARQVLIKLQPLIDDRFFKEVSMAILELLPEGEQPTMRKAIERTASELFAIACQCVSSVTGIHDIDKRRSRKTNDLLSRYYVMFIMCEELHTTSQVTYTELGNLFTPPIHHTVIIHARKMTLQYLESSEEVRRELTNIARLLAKHGHWRTLDKVQSIEPLKSKHITL